MKKINLITAVALILFVELFNQFDPVQVVACDFCMLGQGISPYLTATGKGLTLDANYTESDHVYAGSTGIDSQGKKEAWLIYTLTGFFPVTDHLTVLVSLPYDSKTNIDSPDSAGAPNSGTLTTGIGDATLTGRYTLLKNHTLASTFVGGLLGGFKFPTGNTSLTDINGNPVDRHALPGTGSLDYQIGLTAAYTLASGFQLTSEIVYDFAGPGKWAGRDHRYGNSLNFSVKGFYRAYPSRSLADTVASSTGNSVNPTVDESAPQPVGMSIMPYVGVSGEWMGEERGVQADDGSYNSQIDNPSSGGTELMADIGLYSLLNQNTVVNLGFSKAFYHHMNYDPSFDTDPGENYRLDFSLTFLL